MKVPTGRRVDHIVEEQIKQWRANKTKKPVAEKISVITISREPGSLGNEIAEKLSAEFGYTLFDSEIIGQMAESAKTNRRVLETLDEKGLNLIEEILATLVSERHLWPDQYMKHLVRVIGAIGEHGSAVILGRGANFILPQKKILRLRIIAPLDVRIKRVASKRNISEDEAHKLILKTEAERRSFTRKYFYANIDDPTLYDLIFNTANISVDEAVCATKAVLESKHKRAAS